MRAGPSRSSLLEMLVAPVGAEGYVSDCTSISCWQHTGSLSACWVRHLLGGSHTSLVKQPNLIHMKRNRLCEQGPGPSPAASGPWCAGGQGGTLSRKPSLCWLESSSCARSKVTPSPWSNHSCSPRPRAAGLHPELVHKALLCQALCQVPDNNQLFTPPNAKRGEFSCCPISLDKRTKAPMSKS